MRDLLEAVSEQFGRNLAEARGWAGLSQAQLAEQVGVGQMDISLFERGLQCPRLDVVVALAGALGVHVRDLLFGVE
ncbi:MAG TPA: helix-turn-helix transcriptional regulator [Solirubrobacterales bacterium]|nr:helix-turn-helix transcriptional regulator [Solirubrobacterales bacterium]